MRLVRAPYRNAKVLVAVKSRPGSLRTNYKPIVPPVITDYELREDLTIELREDGTIELRDG